MKKEFNLSEKQLEFSGNYRGEDVKEFIRLIKNIGFETPNFGYGSMCVLIDKLAGGKLNSTN